MNVITTISSSVEYVPGANRLPDYTELEVKNEPMLFNCDYEGATINGGPITQDFLNELPHEWRQCREVPLVIDSRVHMLMPGWYPCIPGWHHDDVPRTRSDGQPNYAPGQCRSEHIMALVNGDICPTEFAIGNRAFYEPELGRTIYADWHKEVEHACQIGELRRLSCPTNRLVHFDDRTWHRGTPTRANGWRFFIRASRYFDPDGNPIARGNARTNEVRRQVQVYMDNVNAGW